MFQSHVLVHEEIKTVYTKLSVVSRHRKPTSLHRLNYSSQSFLLETSNPEGHYKVIKYRVHARQHRRPIQITSPSSVISAICHSCAHRRRPCSYTLHSRESRTLVSILYTHTVMPKIKHLIKPLNTLKSRQPKFLRLVGL